MNGMRSGVLYFLVGLLSAAIKSLDSFSIRLVSFLSLLRKGLLT